MANTIKVSTESLNRTRKEVQDKLDRIRKGIDKISEDMGILNAMWEGDAHTAFAQSAAQDIQRLSVAGDGLQKIIDYEGNAVTEYQKCEGQVRELIDRIRI